MQILKFLISIVFFINFTAQSQSTGTLTDPRDGQAYETLKIGRQEWTAQNMNYQNPNSWCYKNDPENCKKYGRLYSYVGAAQACPPGWRLPNMKDWDKLIKVVGEEAAGIELREGGKTGFNVLMAGVRYDYGLYNHRGENGYFWSHVYADDQPAWVYLFGLTMHTVNRIQSFSGTGFSVRCIRR